MVATASTPDAKNNGANNGSAIPSLDIDPFSIAYFDDLDASQQLLRETGPVVYLDKWNVYGVARYAEVHAVLNDPVTFCSSRGVGLSDFARETPWRPRSIILEADPPEHTRTRTVLSQVLVVKHPPAQRAVAVKVPKPLASAQSPSASTPNTRDPTW